jgi:hypothetical protein
MSAFYLCTVVPRLQLRPGKLVQSTDPSYQQLLNLGALLWPSTDTFVQAASAIALNAHRGWGMNDDHLQSIMLAGVAASLQSGGGTGWASGAILVGGTNTLVVSPGVTGAVFDLSAANAAITMNPGGSAPQSVTVGWTGTENGFTGVFTSATANLQATGFNGGAPSASIPTGQVGGTTTWTWVPAANGGNGLWLKS